MKLKQYDGDFKVYMVNFHSGSITGAMTEDSEGFTTIYIEDQCSPMGKKRAFMHELRHMVNGDLSNDKPIKGIE